VPRLPVGDESAAAGRKARHARKIAFRRVLLSLVVLALAAWLVAAANAPGTALPIRALLLLIATLLPIHLLFWQWEGTKRIGGSSWPRPLKVTMMLVALAASPMVLYPLGLIAVGASLFAGGSATPALAVSGGLMLSPLILLFLIALMFVLGRRKGN
jgi:hypothetical protein